MKINFPNVYKGDLKIFTLHFKDGRKTPLDLANRTIYLTIKRNKYEPDSLAQLQKTWLVEENDSVGDFTIQLSSVDTMKLEEGVYPMDVRVSVAGDPKQIFATLEGLITIEQPVTLDILK